MPKVGDSEKDKKGLGHEAWCLSIEGGVSNLLHTLVLLKRKDSKKRLQS